MNRKINLLAGAVLAASVGTVSAAEIILEDDDLDFHLRPDGDIGLVATGVHSSDTSTLLKDGDVLFAVLEYDKIAGTVLGANEEITGVAVIQASVSPTGVFSFDAYDGGLNAALEQYTGTTWDLAGGEAGGDAIFALWHETGLDATSDLDVSVDNITDPSLSGLLSCSTLTQCVTQAVGGDLYLVAGLVEGTDDYWNAFTGGLIDTAPILAAGATDVAGSYEAGLSVLDPAQSGAGDAESITGGTLFLGNGGQPVDMKLSGAIYGGGGTDDWATDPSGQRDSLIADGFVAFTDNQTVIDIPVPAPLALIGLGMLGLGLRKTRRT